MFTHQRRHAGWGDAFGDEIPAAPGVSRGEDITPTVEGLVCVRTQPTEAEPRRAL
jgi:hypothetical protein